MMRMTCRTFARRTLGLDLTAAQDVIVAVAFDEVPVSALTPAEQEIARAIFGPDVDTTPPEALRVIVLRLGRGSGKTLLTAVWLLYALLRASLLRVGPGDVPVAVAVSVDKKTARLVVRMARELVKRSKALAPLFVADTVDGFTLRRTDRKLVALEAFAASRGGATGRGRTIVSFVLDEAEFFTSDSKYAVTDRDAYGALIARLLLDGKGILISTLWPVETLMGELFTQNWGHPVTALAGLATSEMMRPDDPGLAASIALERIRDAARAAQEFDCDGAALGGDRLIENESLDLSIDHTAPMVRRAWPEASLGTALDLGLTNDPSTLAVGCADASGFVLLQLEERRPTKGLPLKLSGVMADFLAVLKEHGATRVLADGFAREPAREYASAANVEIVSAPEGATGKAAVYFAFARAVKEGRVRIPNHARLIAQLRACSVKPQPGGGYRITNPRRSGSHGDLLSSVVLAHYAATAAATRASAPRQIAPMPSSHAGGDARTLGSFGLPDDYPLG